MKPLNLRDSYVSRNDSLHFSVKGLRLKNGRDDSETDDAHQAWIRRAACLRPSAGEKTSRREDSGDSVEMLTGRKRPMHSDQDNRKSSENSPACPRSRRTMPGPLRAGPGPKDPQLPDQ